MFLFTLQSCTKGKTENLVKTRSSSILSKPFILRLFVPKSNPFFMYHGFLWGLFKLHGCRHIFQGSKSYPMSCWFRCYSMSFGRCQNLDASYTIIKELLVAMEQGIFFLKLGHFKIWSIKFLEFDLIFRQILPQKLSNIENTLENFYPLNLHIRP